MTNPPPIPKGYQQLTGLATPQLVKPPVGISYAIIRCTGGDVRWRDDGQAPTATAGYPLAVGDELVYDSPSGMFALQFIQQGSAAEVSVSFYGV